MLIIQVKIIILIKNPIFDKTLLDFRCKMCFLCLDSEC